MNPHICFCHLNDVFAKGNAATESSSACGSNLGKAVTFEDQACLSCSLIIKSVICHVNKTLLLPSSYACNFQEHPALADVPNTAM